ncbi:preprotein translocase subunit SecE [Dermacoccaceae bacterium W4C1]
MSASSTAADRGADSDAQDKPKGNIFARIWLFIRQVIGEMRKVVWPTRNELVQYTTVVVIFIVLVMLYVVGLDQLIQRGVSWLFGSDSAA